MKRLEKYDHIGWDLDGTLFDHPNTEMFADYIRTNPHDQNFHIVTFRSHGLRDNIDRDLRRIGLNRSHFASVNSVTDEMYERYYLSRLAGNDPDAIRDWMHYKGKTCKDRGAGILIDDMTNDVLPGCREHGIDHVHPDDLTD